VKRDSNMTPKTLSVDPAKCSGCKDCELACAKRHNGINKPTRSRIRIIQGDVRDGFYLPMTCQQCESPPCLAACPNNAISRDNALNRVMIQDALCIGCQMCVSACPFGAMLFDSDLGLAFKCDLCDGDPDCVRVCEPKALDYVEGSRLHHPRIRDSAQRHYKVIRHMVS